MGKIKYYIENFKIWSAANLEYKFTSIAFIILQILISLMGLIVTYSIYNLTGSGIPNWDFYEIIFMIGLNYFIVGIFDFIFHLDNFGRWIRDGEFDNILIKPLHPILQTIELDYYEIGIFLSSLLLLFFSIQKINIVFNLLNIFLFIISMIFGFLSLFSIKLIVETLPFFITNSRSIRNNVNRVRKNFSKWPMSIYPHNFQWFFIFILPIPFFGFIPACLLLNKSLDSIFYLSPIGTIIFLIIAFKFFKYGLSKYSGTGS